MPILDQIQIDLADDQHHLTLYLDIHDNSLSRKWLQALNHLLKNDYHLEKNYCWFGFPHNKRSLPYLCEQINQSIAAINQANLGYHIDDHFTVENTLIPGELSETDSMAGTVEHEKFNHLHRYFEDLQGVSGSLSPYYLAADPTTRWHIRQLNLLCHEYESLALSVRKLTTAPEWQRPTQLMCWLNAPRFELEAEDYELFGVDTINRSLGGVFVGVNKAVGKHHWEVFTDEGRDSRIDELTTTTLRSQTEAAGDFDIEWGVNPANRPWQIDRMAEFRAWLTANGFDPENKALTIGHPQVGQVDLERSFNTTDPFAIWNQLNTCLNVHKIRTSDAQAIYEYNWSDADFISRQVQRISQGN